MRTESKLVNGVWLPATEDHMVPFLEDRAQTVDGRGTYQRKKWQAAIALCRDDRRRRVIDVGSHVGLWSVHLAAAFQHLEAFEPHPLHRDCWERNMQAAGVRDRATLHECAVGERLDRVMLASNPASSGDTWVAPLGTDTRGRELVEVPVTYLDLYGFDDVDLLKIDCEGYELPVLRGARTLLERCRPVVVVEQKLPKPGHDFTARYGYGPTDACAYLESLGATCARVIAGDYLYTWQA